MKRLIAALAALALAAAPVQAQTVATAANASAFPLSSNVLFPARPFGRIALKCFNPAANHAVTIAYASGFAFVLQPGGSLWEVAAANLRGRVNDGAITATGTAAETVQCEDSYLSSQ